MYLAEIFAAVDELSQIEIVGIQFASETDLLSMVFRRKVCVEVSDAGGDVQLGIYSGDITG